GLPLGDRGQRRARARGRNLPLVLPAGRSRPRLLPRAASARGRAPVPARAVRRGERPPAGDRGLRPALIPLRHPACRALAARRAHPALPERKRRRLQLGVDLALLEDVVDVVANRGEADPEPARDLLVRQALGDRAQDLLLALGERRLAPPRVRALRW